MESGEAEACDGGIQMSGWQRAKKVGMSALASKRRSETRARSFALFSHSSAFGHSVEEFAQIGGGRFHFQLERRVAGHLEGLALTVGVPFVLIGQLYGESTLDHSHPLGGGSIELVVTGFHHTNGRFVTFLLETDGFYISVKIFVNFQHVFIPVCTFAQQK